MIAAGTVVVASLGAAAASGDPRGTAGRVTTGLAPAPPITSGTTAPRDRPRLWDPRDVDELPDAADGVAPLLPAVIEPPRAARSLVGAPVEAAVLTVTTRRTVFVLSIDGSWRSVPVPERHAQASLSRGGTRLLFTQQNVVEVWDLTTGARTIIPFPDGLVPWDFTRSKWVDETTFLIDDPHGGWLVDVDGCSARKVPYPTDFAWAVDSGGVVVESASYEEPNLFTDWADGKERRLPMKVIGRLERLVATAETIVGTTYDDGPLRVVVADRSDLTVQAVLPLRDHDANYSNWALGPVGVLDGGVVLLWVAVVGPDDGWRLVAWDPGSGDLSLVARSDAVPTDSVTYAVDLLR